MITISASGLLLGLTIRIFRIKFLASSETWSGKAKTPFDILPNNSLSIAPLKF